MAFPIDELLVQRIVTKLKGITTANSYENNVTDVVRPLKFGGFSPRDRLLVVHMMGRTHDAEEDTEGSGPGRGYQQLIEIECYIAAGTKEKVPIDQRRATLTADVEKLLGTEFHADRWDSMALEATVLSVEPFVGVGGEFEGGTVSYQVLIKTDEANPYTNRFGG